MQPTVYYLVPGSPRPLWGRTTLLRYGSTPMGVHEGALYIASHAYRSNTLNEVDKDRAAALAGVEFSIAPLKADNTTDPGGPSV